jgi:hypothetical protein
MMKLIRPFALSLLLMLAFLGTQAQDAITISPGNFIRGTIQGTDYATVVMKNDDESITQYKAKDIQEFLWNGETFISKPIVIKKKMEFRFFKVVELGAVNLYTIGGGKTNAADAEPKRARIRPSFGVGGGTGGFGGMGGGVGITLGGGGRNRPEAQSGQSGPATYFIEKFGTGPIQELPVEAGNSDHKNQLIRNVLLQKLTNDDDLAERIKATESFDAKLVRAFIAAYNSMHQ